MIPDHVPKNRDGVMAWLKRCRDGYPKGSTEYRTLGTLISKYRDCADYGLRLSPEDEPPSQ